MTPPCMSCVSSGDSCRLSEPHLPCAMVTRRAAEQHRACTQQGTGSVAKVLARTGTGVRTAWPSVTADRGARAVGRRQRGARIASVHGRNAQDTPRKGASHTQERLPRPRAARAENVGSRVPPDPVALKVPTDEDSPWGGTSPFQGLGAEITPPPPREETGRGSPRWVNVPSRKSQGSHAVDAPLAGTRGDGEMPGQRKETPGHRNSSGRRGVCRTERGEASAPRPPPRLPYTQLMQMTSNMARKSRQMPLEA